MWWASRYHRHGSDGYWLASCGTILAESPRWHWATVPASSSWQRAKPGRLQFDGVDDRERLAEQPRGLGFERAGLDGDAAGEAGGEATEVE